MTGTAEVLQLLIFAAVIHEQKNRNNDGGESASASQNLFYSFTVNDRQEYQGRSPLHLAARADHASKVEMLILHGADMELSDKRNRTPMLLSIYWNSHETLALLLEKGARTGIHSSDNMNILHYAARFGDLQTLRILARHRFTAIDPNSIDEYAHKVEESFDLLRPENLAEDDDVRAQSRNLFYQILDSVGEFGIVEVDEDSEGSKYSESEPDVFFDATSELEDI